MNTRKSLMVIGLIVIMFPLVLGASTFFDNPNDFFIMSDITVPSPVVLPTGGGGGLIFVSECLNDSECALGEFCFENKCYVYECDGDVDCNDTKTCWMNRCVKLFDMKIIEVESPIFPGEFFNFTYYLKGVAAIHGDVIIKFWLVQDELVVTEGFDTIYFADFEEKTETSKLFLPKFILPGVYNFYAEVEYDSYYARAGRIIEVYEISEEIMEERIGITGGVIDQIGEGIKDNFLAVLIIMGIILIGIIISLERKRIEKILKKEKKWFEKNIFSLSTALFFVLLIGIVSYLNQKEIISLPPLKNSFINLFDGAWFLLENYWVYLLVIILIILIILLFLKFQKIILKNIIKSKKIFLKKIKDRNNKKKLLKKKQKIELLKEKKELGGKIKSKKSFFYFVKKFQKKIHKKQLLIKKEFEQKKIEGERLIELKDKEEKIQRGRKQKEYLLKQKITEEKRIMLRNSRIEKRKAFANKLEKFLRDFLKNINQKIKNFQNERTRRKKEREFMKKRLKEKKEKLKLKNKRRKELTNEKKRRKKEFGLLEKNRIREERRQKRLMEINKIDVQEEMMKRSFLNFFKNWKEKNERKKLFKLRERKSELFVKEKIREQKEKEKQEKIKKMETRREITKRSFINFLKDVGMRKNSNVVPPQAIKDKIPKKSSENYLKKLFKKIKKKSKKFEKREEQILADSKKTFFDYLEQLKENKHK